MSAVHFHTVGMPTTACGISLRAPGHLTSSAHKITTTCEDCKATHEFASARQRIPEVPRHVG